MPTIPNPPGKECPTCDAPLVCETSGAAGSAYRPGDRFDAAMTIHHYRCDACNLRFMLSNSKLTERSPKDAA
jgi:hypothetical protein